MRIIFLNQDNALRTGWRILAMIALLATAGIVINVGWKALGLPGGESSGPWSFLAFASLIAGSAFGIIVLLLHFFEKRGTEAIGLPFRLEACKDTLYGTLLGAVPVSLLLGVALIGGYGSVTMGTMTLAHIPAVLLPVVITGFLLAGWEELVLRGYLLRQFSSGLNPAAAVIITGVLFGLMHSGNPGANWQGLLYTAIGGILMGWLMVRSGSLWLLIGYHFGWNLTGSTILGLELSGFEDEASIFTSALSGSDWLTGGSYGFEASLPAVVFEVLVLSVALRLVPTSRSAKITA